MAWSPDGSQIAVGRGTERCESDPNLYTIQITDVVSQQGIQNLVGSFCSVTDIDWSPDGTKIAASTLDGLGLRVWDVQTGQLVATVQRGGQGVTSVRWRPDGLVLVVGTVSNGAAIIDPATGAVIGSPPIGGLSLDWSPDGSKLVSGDSVDYQVYVADMVAGQEIMALSGHTGVIASVDWGPDGSKLASGGGIDDPTIRVWNAASGVSLFTLFGHTRGISQVSWNPDSTRLASASSDGSVRVWDISTGQLLSTISYSERVYAVAWSPDGTQLVYGGDSINGQEAQINIIPAPQLPTPTPVPHFCKIAYTTLANGSPQIFIMNAGGSDSFVNG